MCESMGGGKNKSGDSGHLQVTEACTEGQRDKAEPAGLGLSVAGRPGE